LVTAGAAKNIPTFLNNVKANWNTFTGRGERNMQNI
jgi:hypothetical protein